MTRLKILLIKANYFLYKYLKSIIKWKKINGVYLDITHPSISDKELYYISRNCYENSEYNLIKPEIIDNDTIVEFGSGMGFIASVLSKLTKNKIITYEANPNTISLIKNVLRKNNANAILVHAAVVPDSNQTNTVDFFISQHLLASSLTPNKTASKVEVPAVKISDILRLYKPNTLIIDIEGYENEVLTSVDWNIHSYLKKIFVETHVRFVGQESTDSMISYMQESGFVIKKQMNNQLYLKKIDHER